MCRALRWVVAAAAVVTPALGAGAVAVEACPHGGGVVWQVVARLPRPTVAEVCARPLASRPPPDSS